MVTGTFRRWRRVVKISIIKTGNFIYIERGYTVG
jgi:hypothetical protein